MASVDVVIPCYGYGHLLEQCVESVLSQEVDVRALIIDDASPDRTSEVAAALAEKDSRVAFLRHRENRGHIETFNEGIAWASSEYLLLLSADDYLLPGALARAACLMDAHPEMGLAFGKAIDLLDEAGTERGDTAANRVIDDIVRGRALRILNGDRFLCAAEAARSINFIRTPTAVVRTALQQRVGGYRRDLPHSGDWEMWLRLSEHAAVGVIADYQAVYRLHRDSMQHLYYSEGRLPDLRQRKAAFDRFFETSKRPAASKAQWQARLLKPIAIEALHAASRAFNEGKPEVSARLSAFAEEAYPPARALAEWKLLAIKRRLGLKLTRTLLAVADWVRQRMARRVKDSPA